jgi:hypothetical protein
MKTIAERQLSPELVRALNEAEYEPLIIEVRGKRFIVMKESERSETLQEDTSRTSLNEFFRNSPLYSAKLDLERDKAPSGEESDKTCSSVLETLSSQAEDLGPEDMSVNIDHYLYGLPKRG